MDNEQKQELLERLDSQIGIDRFFTQIGLIEVTRNGKKIYSVCPFHEGADSPTGFCWNTDKGFGYCFTHCHKSFSIFDIVIRVMNLEFTEAVSYLCDLVGMEYDFKGGKKVEGNDNRAFLAQVKKATTLIQGDGIEPFDPSIIATFEPFLHTKLRHEGFDHDVRDYFGIGFCRTGYLENRITIPIDYIDESILTVSGRSVLSDEEIEFGKLKKYLIYYETDKSKTLYNISRAIPYIEIMEEVIVVEGFKSVWRLHQWGYRNVVATMGSTISMEQILLLLKTKAKIIVCGDRDEAGKKLNKEVANGVKRYADVSIMDMYDLDVPMKSSIAELSQQQFEFLRNHRKEVV